ncbi:ChaN family lipoprotein [Sulfurimonas sp. HSL3-7]|uniref:ChaN family lipoprotein n=1 Tax=Sulfonitrofixus jiaomeiensis TaxID=3131938 RepID=UPI0031F8DBB4
MKNLSLFVGLLLFFSGCADKTALSLNHDVKPSCTYYSLQRAECLDKEAFIDIFEPYRVIFVGDHHHSANAHKVLTELIDELSRRGYKIALANEWFTPQDDALLKQYVDGELDANLSKALSWKKRVGYDFNLSKPIYDAVIANQGALFGINMSRAFKKKISDQNLTGMSEEERKFYDGLDLNVRAHKVMLSPYFSHCHSLKNGESQAACSERMYRVQVAWDTMMGEESAKLLERLAADEKLIVFVGAMHLENGLGVNMRFARVSNEPFITLLPVPKKVQQNEEIDAHLGRSDLLYLYDN